MNLHHLALKVRALPAMERFYVDILGLQVVERQLDALGEVRSIWLKLGDGLLMLELGPELSEDARGEARGWFLAALSIEEGEKPSWRARLDKYSVPIESESQFSIYFRDPENNRVALSHYPKTAPR